jgi:hypothetical protein
METLRSSSPGTSIGERTQGLAPESEDTQPLMESPPSTIPLDDLPFRDTENATQPIIVLDDDNDQAAAPALRPRRANTTRRDYSYADYEQLMKVVAARNPSRKRKKQKNDTLSLETALVRQFYSLLNTVWS